MKQWKLTTILKNIKHGLLQKEEVSKVDFFDLAVYESITNFEFWTQPHFQELFIESTENKGR